MQLKSQTLLSASLFLLISLSVLYPHAAAALAIDGQGVVNGGTVYLSTILPNDIIVLDEANDTGNGPNPVATISSISDTYGLTWHERVATSSPAMLGRSGGVVGLDTEVWWAYATSSLSSDAITPTFSGGTVECEALIAFGVAGANTSNPWDTNGSLPTTAINTSASYLGGTDASPSVSVSTNEPSTMLLGFMATPYFGVDDSGSQYNASSGYGLLAYQGSICGGGKEADSAVEFQTPVTSQSNATVSFSPAGQDWFAIGDAIQSANQCTPETSPFGLDGSALTDGVIGGAGSTSTQLTTTQPNDVIIALVAHYGGDGLVSDADDLNWIERSGVNGELNEWYAVANCPLSSDTITITTKSGGSYTGINVFAVSGANTNNIFDPNGSLPATSATTSVSISTSHANDFIFAAITDYNGIASSNGAGWTEIDGTNGNGGFFSENQTVSALQVNLTASFLENYPGGEGILGDAIQEATSQLVGRLTHLGHSNTIALSSGLVGYWPFDGGVTSWKTDTTQDQSGNGNTGNLASMSTTTSPVAGKIGGALKFNGTSNYVNVSPFPSTTNPLTISAWVYPTSFAPTGFGSGNGGTIIEENESGGGAGWIFGISDGGSTGQLWFWPSGGNDKFSTNTVPLNKWTHVVATYDGTSIRFYINGVLNSVQTMSAPQGSATFLKIGAKAWTTGYWQGKLDEVRLYNRALSPQEVLQLYHLGTVTIAQSNTVALSSGLIGHWPLNGPRHELDDRYDARHQRQRQHRYHD